MNEWVETGKPKVKEEETAKEHKKLDVMAMTKTAVEALAKVSQH